MRSRVAALRAPILLASILVLSGVGYAAYTSGATLGVNSSSASFYIEYTDFAIVGPVPPNIVTFHYSSVPSAHVTMAIGNLTPGESLVINYTVEDFGTRNAINVNEQIPQISASCDSRLTLSTLPSGGPTDLTSLVPANGTITLTDLGEPSPPPSSCQYAFTASWYLIVTGTAV